MAAGVLSLPLSAFAIPAAEGLVKSAQPDGTPVEIRLHGDERFNWATSPDGFTLLRDADGFWTVAEADANGEGRPSAIIYHGAEARSLAPQTKPGLPVSAAAATMRKAGANNLNFEKSFPTSGKRNLLMILVNFSNTTPTFTRDDFDAMMNSEGYLGIGSFRDYYLQNSYGKLDVTTTVTRWVNLNYEKSHYTIDNVAEIIREALSQLDSELDLRQFDNDGDGVIDGISIIHQGAGQEASGDYSDIWSHSSSVSGIEFDGVKVDKYTIEPETLHSRMTTIGVICHEFGHNLGAPDFYDTDYSGSGGEFPGTGVWDLMGSGAWNGTNKSGDRPASVNMWQKIQYGWVVPVQLADATSVKDMADAAFNPVAYRFEAGVPGEYFILENRCAAGPFDSALPSGGLLVYHANDPMIRARLLTNTLNTSYPQSVYTVCSGSGRNPNSYPSSYGDLSDAPFPGSSNATTFCDTSFPSTLSIVGERFAYKSLRNIAVGSDGRISFDFVPENAPASPEDFRATAARGRVYLSWQLPAADEAPVRFNVYRGGVKVGETDKTSYVDTETDGESLLTYQVDAEYASGLVSPYVEASIRVPVNMVESLEAEVDENDKTVTLNWTIPTRLSRMSGFSYASFDILSQKTDRVTIAHRFSADDLAVYRGSRIRRVAFNPYQSPQDVTYTVKVWEADGSDGTPRVVSERAVKECGVGSWTPVLLTTPVEISGDKDLLIGIEMSSKTGKVEYICEYEGTTLGLGNLIKIGDGDWTSDPDANGSFFIYAEISLGDVEAPVAIEDRGDEIDPERDFFYPVGFIVSRDGETIGTTASRFFRDLNPGGGEHVYSVASLYRGDNESSASEITVNLGGGEDGVTHVEADCGPVVYYNLQGLRVAVPVRGEIYIRVSDKGPKKIRF